MTAPRCAAQTASMALGPAVLRERMVNGIAAAYINKHRVTRASVWFELINKKIIVFSCFLVVALLCFVPTARKQMVSLLLKPLAWLRTILVYCQNKWCPQHVIKVLCSVISPNHYLQGRCP